MRERGKLWHQPIALAVDKGELHGIGAIAAGQHHEPTAQQVILACPRLSVQPDVQGIRRDVGPHRLLVEANTQRDRRGAGVQRQLQQLYALGKPCKAGRQPVCGGRCFFRACQGIEGSALPLWGFLGGGGERRGPRQEPRGCLARLNAQLPAEVRRDAG